MALTIQSKIILYFLAAAGVLYFLGLVFLLLLKRTLKALPQTNAAIETGAKAERRKGTLRLAAFTSVWFSVGLALASAISIHQTISAMELISHIENVSSVQITAGKALDVLQWLAFAFSAVFAVGISLIFRKNGGVIESVGSAGPPGMGMAMAGGGGVSMAPPPPPPPPFV
jgi:hypothetical protein